MTELSAIRQRLSALRSKTNTAGLRALGEALDALWRENPEIEALAWFQYTPVFDFEGVGYNVTCPPCFKIGGVWYGEDARHHAELDAADHSPDLPQIEGRDDIETLLGDLGPILERVHGTDVRVECLRQAEPRVSPFKTPFTWTSTSRSDEWP